MWDLPYWRRRQREHLFQAKNLEEYFPYEKVLEGLFGLSRDLFGISIQEKEGIPVPHPTVKYYEVHDVVDGTLLGSFYLDPYSRRGKMNAIYGPVRGRNEYVGVTPVGYLSLGVHPPFRDFPTYMSFQSVNQLFFLFGECLQDILSQAPYCETHGAMNVEEDARSAFPGLMMSFLRSPVIMKQITEHVDTKEPIPDQLVDTINKVYKHMSNYDVMHQLYVSAFEIEMFIHKESYAGMMNSIWEDFIPIQISQDDMHMSSSDIWVSPYMSMKYSVLWSKIMAAEFHQEFESVGFENLDKMAMVGKRLRESYLSQLGCVTASEGFRRFKGRDPAMKAFIDEQSS